MYLFMLSKELSLVLNIYEGSRNEYGKLLQFLCNFLCSNFKLPVRTHHLNKFTIVDLYNKLSINYYKESLPLHHHLNQLP